MLQIAQTSMNQFGGAAGSTKAKIFFFYQQYPQAAQSRVAGDARTVNTASHDQKIEFFFAKLN